MILADLTGKNPNVFYEVGLAHATGKPVILISQDMNDIPFDLRGLRIIEYNKNLSNWGEKLKSDIKNSISATLRAPLNSVLPTFFKIEKESQDTVSPVNAEFISMKQEIEQLRKELRFYPKANNTPLSNTTNLKSLTLRDLRILELFAEGHTIKDIAKQLNVSIHNIKSIRSEILIKTGSKSMTSLLADVLKSGLINFS